MTTTSAPCSQNVLELPDEDVELDVDLVRVTLDHRERLEQAGIYGVVSDGEYVIRMVQMVDCFDR
ncbi:hypothetical protein [Natrarchaeobaculum sulfurireducens]|uniref:hypothetical protein n=1 Tax=Natrarchaeobaculum sulfurireducens TaxID=2044521 RepID=UPI00105AB0CA|nr:hypothetical protein [Natrarchaeobaculum sulfurireducens]